jgi:hypothetical protein
MIKQQKYKRSNRSAMSNDTSHSKQKQDYRKDTLCTADIFQEKDCIGFKSMAGSGMCMFQGLGFVCEAEEGRNVIVRLK